MSLFKFHDSNFLNGYNRPEVTATANTYNGYQFKLVDDVATVFTDATDVQAGDQYVMYNIIDKPEILNTDEYCVESGEYIRAFRLADFVGQKIDISADLVTDAYGDVEIGDYLVGRSTADTTDTMKWKVVEDSSNYAIYLEVLKKTTFGAFTVDADGGTVLGGYLCEIKSN